MERELRRQKLTEKEIKLVKAMFKNAKESCGAENVEDLITDNYSWITIFEIEKMTNFSYNQIKGLLGSLFEKKVIELDLGICFNIYFLEKLENFNIE